MSFLISDAWAEAPAAGAAAAPGIEQFLPLFILFAVAYFLLIRPQMKRQKEHKKLVDALSKGDEVQTMGGLMGKITDIGDNFCKLEVAEGVEVTIRRSAIEAVMPKGSLKEL